MTLDAGGQVLLSGLIFLVALLYSSVGHGGASGYLAILSFLNLPHEAMSTTALVLNLIVAGLAFYSYRRANYFKWRLVWPFLITSMPAAFLGGVVHIEARFYYLLLAAVLLIAAWQMWRTPKSASEEQPERFPSLPVALGVGVLLGFVSGVVGVGGGMFLSPLMIGLGWAGAKETSAVSAAFILANSLSGLGGRLVEGTLLMGGLWPIILAGFLGGLIGSHIGAVHLSTKGLKRVLALVLVIAAFKMVLQYH